MYEFNLAESGWYNIDILFNEPEATQVALFAKVKMQEKFDVAVYLCIPKRKVLMEADKNKDDIYIFHYTIVR